MGYVQRRVSTSFLLLSVLTLSVACATRFSPDTIRSEIVRQRGSDPLGVFELNLGRFTTLLLKSALATEDGKVPFAGLSRLQVAVFEAGEGTGPVIDVTQIPVRGWEPVIRAVDEQRSALVLVQGGGASEATIGDLVVVGSGPRKVIYARLQGALNAELPTALADVLREGGPDEMRRMLVNLSEGSPGG